MSSGWDVKSGVKFAGVSMSVRASSVQFIYLFRCVRNDELPVRTRFNASGISRHGGNQRMETRKLLGCGRSLRWTSHRLRARYCVNKAMTDEV